MDTLIIIAIAFFSFVLGFFLGIRNGKVTAYWEMSNKQREIEMSRIWMEGFNNFKKGESDE